MLTIPYGREASMNLEFTVIATSAVTACKPIGTNNNTLRQTTQP